MATQTTSMMGSFFFSFLVLLFLCGSAISGEYTIELEDRDKQCFHQIFSETDKEVVLEFQVIRGGNFDVDVRLFSPSGQVLYDGQRKQYDSITFKLKEKGEYYFCFSNEFSSFTHKTIYFDMIDPDADDEFKDALSKAGDQPQAYTLMENSLVSVHESLKIVEDYQTHHRLREFKARNAAEELNGKVLFWSMVEAGLIILVGIGQVFILRRFFTDKKSTI